MNYEEKYKSALEWMRSIYPTMQGADKEDAEHYFPELRESDDEKIKRCIQVTLTDVDEKRFNDYDTTLKDCLAWLEKQGEQKSTVTVKSKFKIGDWITNGYYIWRVTSINPLDYILQSPNGDVVDDTISYVDENLYLWTIEDAKDGDVVVNKSDGTIGMFQSIGHHPDGGSYNDPSYCFLHCRYDDGFFYADFENGNTMDSDDAIPATKEQRDLLFQKMKEAGYEWNAEEKELRKIEQKPVEWSEEDEKMKSLIISTLTSMGTLNLERYHHMNLDEVKNWLKSFKPNHWKPSEEQMQALIKRTKGLHTNSETRKVLESLIFDLQEKL